MKRPFRTHSQFPAPAPGPRPGLGWNAPLGLRNSAFAQFAQFAVPISPFA